MASRGMDRRVSGEVDRNGLRVDRRDGEARARALASSERRQHRKVFAERRARAALGRDWRPIAGRRLDFPDNATDNNENPNRPLSPATCGGGVRGVVSRVAPREGGRGGDGQQVRRWGGWEPNQQRAAWSRPVNQKGFGFNDRDRAVEGGGKFSSRGGGGDGVRERVFRGGREILILDNGEELVVMGKNWGDNHSKGMEETGRVYEKDYVHLSPTQGNFRYKESTRVVQPKRGDERERRGGEEEDSHRSFADTLRGRTVAGGRGGIMNDTVEEGTWEQIAPRRRSLGGGSSKNYLFSHGCSK